MSHNTFPTVVPHAHFEVVGHKPICFLYQRKEGQLVRDIATREQALYQLEISIPDPNSQQCYLFTDHGEKLFVIYNGEYHQAIYGDDGKYYCTVRALTATDEALLNPPDYKRMVKEQRQTISKLAWEIRKYWLNYEFWACRHCGQKQVTDFVAGRVGQHAEHCIVPKAYEYTS